MNEKFSEYIKDRYEGQVEWYDKKSVFYKKLGGILQISIIVPAAIVPIVATLGYRWPTIVLSALVAVMTTILKYFKFEELWHHYRLVCESLKKEKHMHDFRIGEYEDTKEPEKLFIERVESVIAQEHKWWVDIRRKKEA